MDWKDWRAATTRPTPNVKVLENGIIVWKYDSGLSQSYTAWERDDQAQRYSERSLSTFAGVPGYYGQLSNRDAVKTIPNLPVDTLERIDFIEEYRQPEYEEAYRHILQAFPEAASGHHHRGEIFTRVVTNPSSPPHLYEET